MLVTTLQGGGGGAVHRLLQGVRNLGVDCRALVQDDTVCHANSYVIKTRRTLLTRAVNLALRKLRSNPMGSYPNREPALFSIQHYTDNVAAQASQLTPDLIHLHWICNDWIGVSSLGQFRRPVIWTCHDMWPMTGGCHYSGACDRYTHQCGRCPVLHSDRDDDLSRRVWQRKAKALRGSNFTLVCPSRWMAGCARSSSLFSDVRVEVIPNGIALETFRPLNRLMAREVLGLPQDKRIVLFGAWENSPRKGLHLLIAALRLLCCEGWRDRLEPVIFGFDKPSDHLDSGLRTHYLGLLHDPLSLALAYSAADVFVVPSIDENLPTTAIEAIACATPCVGFRTGGLPDIIEHWKNGYLAEPYDPADLASGIAWVLESENRRRCLGERGRQKAQEEFSNQRCAERHVKLYRELCTDLGDASA